MAHSQTALVVVSSILIVAFALAAVFPTWTIEHTRWLRYWSRSGPPTRNAILVVRFGFGVLAVVLLVQLLRHV